jgi:aspartate-semialdehyde dehydrogenase
MRDDGYVVAVIGAAREEGREVRTALAERGFPLARLGMYDAADRLANGSGDDVEAPPLPLDRIDLEGVDLVFTCGTESQAREWAPRAVEAGAVVIDLTQAFADQEDVPLIVPEVNPDVVGDGIDRGVLCSPAPGAIALSVILRPLDDAARLKRVVVAAFEPVSSAGRDAVEELARQTRDLLNGRSVESLVFPHRVAFNAIPQVGDFLAGGRTRGEWQIESETRRVLDLPDVAITATSVRIPTFFGQGYAVNVELMQPIDAARALAVLRESKGILALDDPATASYPTLVEALESDAVYVGRLRDDVSVPSGLNAWVAIDGARKGGAVNAVQIAEIVVREHR